jgi:hypothetical protein
MMFHVVGYPYFRGYKTEDLDLDNKASSSTEMVGKKPKCRK